MNGGINYGDAFHTSMTILGCIFVIGGISLIVISQKAVKRSASMPVKELIIS
jgi:hypothetical protein